MTSIVKKMYGLVVGFQIILFIFFIVLNIDNLDSIEFSILVNGVTETVEINMYAILGLLGALFLIVIVSGINLFGMGLNEEGSKNVAKYLSFIGTVSMLIITSSYFLLQFGAIGLLCEMLFFVVYLFYILESLQGSAITVTEG